MGDEKKCIGCGRALFKCEGVWLCPRCNRQAVEVSDVFIDHVEEAGEYIFIECPGATLYAPGTHDVIAGVRFHDDDDPLKGHRIVDHPVYAPNHNRKRRIKREALGKIRRCQACQDYTVRMRRKEGPDFFIPSSKHPDRQKLRSVRYKTYEP